jgi:hypothetical protein
MMRQMRENTKWIMLVTAIAFVGLMLFQWGMDATGRTSGSMGDIGRVNGTPVQYEAYMGAYRNLYDQTQISQADPISTQQNRELEQAAWDQLVERILIGQELDRRGIDVTDEEIRQAARFQPPAEFRENPAFLTEGNFDLVKYQQFLANSADPQLFVGLEAYYRNVLPQGKLMRQVATGVFITDAELWEQYRDVHETTLVRFVPLDPAQRVPDDSVTVTDAEMEKYWRDHQDEFEVPARASVKVIVLPKAPTSTDSAAANLRAATLLDEIRAGANFDSVGNREAAALQPVTFQDLGTFGRDAMTPVFDTAAFAAPVGRATGPLQTSFGYHLLLVSKRTGDSATAKHILVPITRTEESEDAILMLADSTENLAEDLTLEEVGRIMGFEVGTAELNDAFPFLPGIGMASDGADWAFQEAEPGDVSEVFENDQSFYALELVSSTPGGVTPLDEAKRTIHAALLIEKKLTVGTAEGQRLVELVKSGVTLSDAAAEMDLRVRTPGPFTRQDFVPDLGQMNAAIGTAFGLATGSVSDPVPTQQNVFVMEKIAHTPADSTIWLAQKQEQRQALTGLIQQQRLQDWIQGLRNAARIVDRRAEALTPVDDPIQTPYSPSPLGF